MSESRADTYTWSDPYVDNSQVFLVNKYSGITTHADLVGKVVAVQAGSAALDIGIAQYHMATSRKEFLILEEALALEVYAIGFLLGNTDLHDLIQGQLAWK